MSEIDVIELSSDLEESDENPVMPKRFVSGSTRFVVSKTKKMQRLSKIFSAYFQRLFKDLREQSAVEKLRV
jgi:hypothetical protein